MTTLAENATIAFCLFLLLPGVMFIAFLKILLPKGIFERDARTQRFLKIKPRFTNEGFRRLIILLLLFSFFLGYQPTLNFYPIRASLAFAQAPEVTQSITAQELPVMTLPFDGYLSTRFSYYHPGIDIATALGTSIHPVADGTVAEVNFDFLGYGHHVIISHSDSVTSLYGHMDKAFVKVGQTVTTKDILGTVGLTGFTSGPHTHLEIHQNGKAIDPLPLLPKIQAFPSPEYLRPVGGNTPYIAPLTTPEPSPTDLHKSLKPNF